jgi:hypothetical protein
MKTFVEYIPTAPSTREIVLMLILFAENSDGRSITDAKQRSAASSRVVLQHHSWAVRVIITSPTWFCKVAHSYLRAGKQI